MILTVSLLLNVLLLITTWQRNVVISVPDGDSLQMQDGRRVRLLGIDAPERGQCMAENAQKALEQAAKGKHVRLKNVVTDDYGRQLADVIIDDAPSWVSYLRSRFVFHTLPTPDPYINRMAVANGLARYTGSTKNDDYKTIKMAQTNAKTNKIGIWSDTCRKSSNPDCSIKGNTRAGKKIYLLPDCNNYDQTIIDTSYQDQWFCTEAEAVKAGFTKSPTCTKN